MSTLGISQKEVIRRLKLNENVQKLQHFYHFCCEHNSLNSLANFNTAGRVYNAYVSKMISLTLKPCTLYLQSCQKRNIIPNNKQHTTQIHATRYKVVGSNPAAAKIFYFICMFSLGIANGAKVGLKLRLLILLYNASHYILQVWQMKQIGVRLDQ